MCAADVGDGDVTSLSAPPEGRRLSFCGFQTAVWPENLVLGGLACRKAGVVLCTAV